MNYYDLISLILTQLHERINSDEFLERFRRPNSFVRYRKLTLKQVVAYLIHSKKRSMDIELSDLQRQLPDIDFPDVSRQAVSKARKGILPDLFKELLDKQVEMVYTHLDCPKNWFGYRVFAVDGSTLEIATVYKGNIIKNLIMDCQSYTKYRPNETTGGIFVSWRRKEELPTGA